MANRLKLKRDVEFRQADPEPAHRLIFPVEAVRSLPRWGSGSVGARGETTSDVVREVERTMDRMQAGLDQLHSEVRDSMRLVLPAEPAPGHRPSAA